MQAILRKRVSNSKGVTLVELLAVLVILGIIALIAVPAIAGVIDDSKESSIKSTAINTINAVELYSVTNDLSDNAISDLAHSEIEGEYVKDRDGFEWVASDNTTNTAFPTFGVNSDDEITITGTGEIDGVTVTFEKATINDINESDSTTVDGTSTGDGN